MITLERTSMICLHETKVDVFSATFDGSPSTVLQVLRLVFDDLDDWGVAGLGSQRSRSS